MHPTDNEETSLTFPCEYPIKIIGPACDHFEMVALNIVHKHVPHLSETAISLRKSAAGKYASLTVTFTAESKAQLDALYQELTAAPEILMVF